MIEHHIVHQVDDDVLLDPRAGVHLQLDAEIAWQRVVGDLDDAGHAGGPWRPVPIVVVHASHDGAVGLGFVRRGQLNRLLHLERVAEGLEPRCQLHEALHGEAVSIADRHEVLPGLRTILPHDETVQQLEGRTLLQPPLGDRAVIEIDRPRVNDGPTLGRVLEYALRPHACVLHPYCSHKPQVAGGSSRGLRGLYRVPFVEGVRAHRSY